jgi:triosephosphate isomerase
MKPSNAKELLQMPDIDGGLVGNASLKPEDFKSVVEIAASI